MVHAKLQEFMKGCRVAKPYPLQLLPTHRKSKAMLVLEKLQLAAQCQGTCPDLLQGAPIKYDVAGRRRH